MPDKPIGLERIFPGIDEMDDDLLGGLSDYTFGQAVEYFSQLSEDDRELVQWFAREHIGSFIGIGYYLEGLVQGYCIVDPMRTSEQGKIAAHEEIDRLDRFAALFLASKDYFPMVAQIMSTETDPETGTDVEVIETGWRAIGVHGPYGSLGKQREELRQNFLPMLAAAREFIDSPVSNDFFDQEAIFAAYQEELKNNQS